MTPFHHSPALERAQLAEEAEARRWLEMAKESTERHMTKTEEPKWEIVPPDAEIAEPAKHLLVESFQGFFAEAEKWKRQTENITDAKLARAARLELKKIRVDAEKTRKKLKEESLRMGKAIDGANNILLAILVPIEQHMEDVEKQEERRLAAERAAREESRMEKLRPLIDPMIPAPAVADLTDEQFAEVLNNAKLLQAAKIADAKRIEDERIAREKAEAEERERVRAENERLKAEAAAKEAELKAEREAAAKAKAEREEAEAKARKDREELEAKLKAEREAREKAEAAARAKAEADAKARRDAEAAAKKAAAAPDREKILAFAAIVEALVVPEMATSEGQAAAAQIAAKVKSFAKWIKDQAP